jgi:hypothetical protein
MSIVLQSTGGGSVTINEPTTASNFTQTLPASTGTVMVSGNMPAFSAYMSASQSVTSSTTTKMAFNTELFDTASCFDTSTYRFTPNVAGYYQVNIIGTGNATGGSILQISLYKNGGNYVYSDNRPSFNVLTANINDVVYMNGTTDYIEAYGYVTGTSPALFGSAVYSRFSASMIRSA